MHPCELELKELKEIERQLFAEESTDENMKKLTAVQSQIKRREKEEANANAEAGETKDTGESAPKAENFSRRRRH